MINTLEMLDFDIRDIIDHKPRVLITGCTGMVGSHMADYLLDKAHIIGLKRWRSPLDNVKHLEGKIEFYNGDLKDLSSMINLIQFAQPDIIFHFAAQSEVSVSFTMPSETLQDNILGTLNLLEAVRYAKLNPIIVIASSSEVYGQVTYADLPIKETCPLRPMSPYAVSKVGEDLLSYQYFQSYGMRIIRTRLFTHTGARRHHAFHESSFARQIVQIEKGLQEPIIEVGNLDSIRTYLDVRDAVRAYWMVKDCTPGEVYNIGGDYTCSVGDTLNKLISLSTFKGKIEIHINKNRLRPSDVTLQVPCVEKFKKESYWKPEIKFEETLSSLLRYWRDLI